jgi:hypothetical protein
VCEVVARLAVGQYVTVFIFNGQVLIFFRSRSSTVTVKLVVPYRLGTAVSSYQTQLRGGPA